MERKLTLHAARTQPKTMVNKLTVQRLKVLFVCSGNHGFVPAFIQEQKDGLEKNGIQVDLFQIKGRGVSGYLKNYTALLKTINTGSYHLVHAHFGLSGLLANLQWKVPVITTFHGCDLNNKKHRTFSRLAARLSKRSIVVSDDMAGFLANTIKKEVIPCGVDMTRFVPVPKSEARAALTARGKKEFQAGVSYVLFSSTFDRDVKNPRLAFDALQRLGTGYELIELKNLSREEVMLMMNAADATLLTSRTEGSPQFIKEAMACSRPIVTTCVGDVDEIIGTTEGCFITEPEAKAVADALKKAMTFDQTNGRDVLGTRYDNAALVRRIITLYTNL
jgi:glycosyltransferase involved in cell wall biosynthesis